MTNEEAIALLQKLGTNIHASYERVKTARANAEGYLYNEGYLKGLNAAIEEANKLIRELDTPTVDTILVLKKEFMELLRQEVPEWVDTLSEGNIERLFIDYTQHKRTPDDLRMLVYKRFIQ